MCDIMNVEHTKWNLSYQDHFYPDTSIIWAAQINYVICSLLLLLKFWLEVQERNLKVVVHLLGGLHFLLIATIGCIAR